MRPRLIAVDDFSATGAARRHAFASMRPRLIAVDDLGFVRPGMNGFRSFNEATAYCRG